MAAFPSSYETKCTGYSLIISQVSLLAASGLFSIDFDTYNIQDEAQIIELHNVVSSPEHRVIMEVGSTLVWIAFPFFVIALHGVKKMGMAMFQGTKAENLIYLAEKAYTMWIFVSVILLPAFA